jgi:hypothetical protein
MEAMENPCSSRVARAIEEMTAGAEDVIERLQMQRVGVGQRTVNVEQQRHPRFWWH